MFALGDVPPPTPSIHHIVQGDEPTHSWADTGKDSEKNLFGSGAQDSLEDTEPWLKASSSAVDMDRFSGEIHKGASKKSFDGDAFTVNGEIPSPSTGEIHTRDFTQGTPAFYSLYYACLLVPRLPGHHLVGDLSARLPRYVRHIFLAYGWRLKHLEIKPGSLQWIVSLPPDVPPGNIVSLMRQHTSERIFSDFPRLAQENPSGDFWAPGYLLMSGQSALPEQVTKYFIDQTRKRQGL